MDTDPSISYVINIDFDSRIVLIYLIIMYKIID